ncbi:MAG: glycine--tRNA ligase subunit beta, partial [Gammaproteobacteria bacterium]
MTSNTPERCAETLLVEIRTEELPPKLVRELAASFPRSLCAELNKAGFVGGIPFPQYTTWATPRRFVALLANIKSESPEKEIFRRGPQTAACRDSEGAPTKALIGFMQSAGATCEKDLIETEEKGKKYIAWKGMQPGKKLADELPAIVERVLLNLPAPRLMRWGDNDFKFIRPIRGVMLLHGKTHIAGKIMNIAATETTKGHPIMSEGEITINHASDYEDALREKGKVIICWESRYKEIENYFRETVSNTSYRLPTVYSYNSMIESYDDDYTPSGYDENLVGEVAAMCEKPAVYLGEIDGNISLPDFCVIGCMEKHHRFFHLLDSDTGKLSRAYLLVADNAPENPAPMIAGFNAVLRARLRDVQFYYNEDKKIPLENYIEKLKSITYHQKLGSQYDRVCRLQKIAAAIGELMDLSGAAKSALDIAARVCKADLPTLMIGEYPEFEGKMAAEYFCENKDMADIVGKHNLPEHGIGMSGENSRVCFALALADNLEKLAAMFGIGEKPDGNKDPHGLRGAAARIAHTLSTDEPELPGDKLLQITAAAFGELPQFDANEIWDFIVARARYGLIGTYYNDDGESEEILIQKLITAQDAQNAVFAKRNFLLADMQKRYDAMRSFGGKDAETLIAANKRINNIFRKSGVNPDDLPAPDESLFGEAAERALARAVADLQKETQAHIAKNDYAAALKTLAKAAAPVGAFFDEVLVNAEDEKIRRNRFALLRELRALLNCVAD